eukprot:TRINITY_DN3611_c0_g1_i1.p1 TRINITY_DN3611_c0_g1~~TRINITY_DN3611_c0_g1_i1.p1  ORF type:complete len:228 (+),score=14.18 TRINITY_DN3611_c0_g1_i1:52-735(+)
MAAGKLTKKACVCIFLALIFFGCALATSFIAFRSFWYHDDYKSDTVQIDTHFGLDEVEIYLNSNERKYDDILQWNDERNPYENTDISTLYKRVYYCMAVNMLCIALIIVFLLIEAIFCGCGAKLSFMRTVFGIMAALTLGGGLLYYGIWHSKEFEGDRYVQPSYLIPEFYVYDLGGPEGGFEGSNDSREWGPYLGYYLSLLNIVFHFGGLICSSKIEIEPPVNHNWI